MKATLLPFPRDDRAFVLRAEGWLQDLDPDVPERLEALLRLEYPDAVVRPRDDLGTLDGTNQAWYVYRDGRPTRPDRIGSRILERPSRSGGVVLRDE